MKYQTTVRFSQVDPAGIVFYARYFEMISRIHPDGPLNSGAFEIETEFRRPNRWGDCLDIEFQDGGCDNWSYSGQLDGLEHFRISSVRDKDPVTTAEALGPPEDAFRTTSENVGVLEVDGTGRMAVSRYFERLSEAVELWIEDAFGLPFPELHLGKGIGMPTVRFMTYCRSLPQAGAPVSLAMQPIRLGTKSVTFRSWLITQGNCLVTNDQVVVFVQFKDRSYRSINIPQSLKACIRARMPRQQADEQSGHVAP